jgi:ABC-type sulfate/molybdate transport systems ATPase subunit
VLLSSHEPELAIPLSDRVVVMSGGRITGNEEGGRRSPLSALPAVEPPPGQGTMGTWHVA